MKPIMINDEQNGTMLLNLDHVEFVRKRKDSKPGLCVQMRSGEQFFVEHTLNDFVLLFELVDKSHKPA